MVHIIGSQVQGALAEQVEMYGKRDPQTGDWVQAKYRKGALLVSCVWPQFYDEEIDFRHTQRDYAGLAEDRYTTLLTAFLLAGASGGLLMDPRSIEIMARDPRIGAHTKSVIERFGKQMFSIDDLLWFGSCVEYVVDPDDPMYVKRFKLDSPLENFRVPQGTIAQQFHSLQAGARSVLQAVQNSIVQYVGHDVHQHEVMFKVLTTCTMVPVGSWIRYLHLLLRDSDQLGMLERVHEALNDFHCEDRKYTDNANLIPGHMVGLALGCFDWEFGCTGMPMLDLKGISMWEHR